jgi:hypothetical protein
MGSGRIKAFGFSVSGLPSSVFRPPFGNGNSMSGTGVQVQDIGNTFGSTHR